MTELTDDDARDLEQEASARNDFEYAVDTALHETVETPPAGPDQVFEIWARVLGDQQVLLEGGAALKLDDPSGPLRVAGYGKISPFEWELLPGLDLPCDIRRSIVEGKRCCGIARSKDAPKLDGCYVMVEPIRESNAALAVATRSNRINLISRMLKHATAQAGLVLAMRRIADEREIGLRQMAGRISHMCSSSILLARCRLNELLNQEGLLAQEARSAIKKAIVDLDEAQQGFERARLLALPSKLYAKDLDVGELLLDVVASVDSATSPPIASDNAAKECAGARGVSVHGSRGRLRYAFRDLMLLTWLLGERKPVEVHVESDADHVRVRIVGGVLRGDIWGNDIEGKLRDPDTYLVAPDERKAERGIGLQLAWTLIEDEKGKLRAQVIGGQLCFEVKLPAVRKSMAVKSGR